MSINAKFDILFSGFLKTLKAEAGMKNWGSILEPACLYADQGISNVRELAKVVKRFQCRSAVVHYADVQFLFDLSVERIAVVIDFPYGKGGIVQRHLCANQIFKRRISKIDICVNFADVLNKAFDRVEHDFNKFQRYTERILFPEIKAIIQLPYLWQYAPNLIEPLVTALANAGVKVIKDWTTVFNFSKPFDVSIVKRNLPLKIKIAGGVRKENARAFVDGGADILGVSVQFVPDVIKALESSE